MKITQISTEILDIPFEYGGAHPVGALPAGRHSVR